jgi:UDP-N-acetylglucosamine--N-acetylmuramyl-(pentapeptide) pyrophosphoryl-undecaprenol N-acetylglucosamine transferase
MEQSVEKSSVICYIAGHSGGHIIPCLTLAQQEKKSHHRILFISSTKPLDSYIIKQNATVDYHHTLSIIQKRRWYLLPLLAISLGYAFLKSLFILLWYRPQRIISSGSIIAIPGCLAAWLLRIPIELFEVNAKPGKTIAFLAYIATRISVCFSQTKHYFPTVSCLVQPYPIRFAQSEPIPTTLSHFDSHRFTIFIQGGSQGSATLNELMQYVIENNSNILPHIQIIHQTGTHIAPLHTFYQEHKIPAYIFSFEHDVSQYYRKANLIICRAGAGTLFEVLHFEKRCLVIPLIAATTCHQLDNAYAMARAYPSLFQVVIPNKSLFTSFEKSFILSIKKG